MKIFDFLKKFKRTTTSLEEHYEKKAYMAEKLKQAEIKGKKRAKAEAREGKRQSKTAFEKFQDYATNFTNQPSAIGKIKFNSRRKK